MGLKKKKFQRRKLQFHSYRVEHMCSCTIMPGVCDSIDHSPSGSSVHRFSRQEYWSVLPFPTPECLPHPGIKPVSLACPALADGLFTPGTNQEVQNEKLSPKEGK